MTVLENIGRVRNAKKLAKQMGVTIRRSVPDEINPLSDRYETVVSLGLDSKSARLSPSGKQYVMKDSPTKAIATSVGLLGGAAVGGMYAYRSLTGPNKDVFTAVISGLVAAGCVGAVFPYTFDIPV